MDKENKKYIHTAGLVVIEDNKLLLAYSNNKKAWYLPGGKVDDGETSLQSLQREIWEELTLKVEESALRYYCHVTAPAYGEEAHVIMEQDCFLYELVEDITPANEIGGVKFFDLDSYREEAAQVVGVIDVFRQLQADGLIR
ncbi:NUDIX hydrolase [Sphingobacterium sp. LRF_L2]|uniref:NUDIX hydrolase n=1 Tax=Sphingobacterium sp. LRF_L2 TaxID=3369421 RepID=UPI003F6318E0